MNIIFLTICRINDINEKDINNDLLRLFRKQGHSVYVVTPHERRFKKPTEVKEQDGIHILGVKTLNIQKTNVIEKGIGTVLVESQFQHAIKKFWGKVSFDLILYVTPPITFPNVIRYLKHSNPEAKTYLLLKDIFPQNAVDLGLLRVNGLLYRYFRKKEKTLYQLSDYIGCMSPANVRYLLANNPSLTPDKVEENPNCQNMYIEYRKDEEVAKERKDIRKKYGIPSDVTVFVYGGNLGKPQGLGYLIKALEANSKRKDCFFLIVGDGTEFNKIENWISLNRPGNCKLLRRLPKLDYDALVRACDVGVLCLDHRFTIPNFPSRMLSYMEFKMPIIAATDPCTDVGRIAEDNGYGYWCESNSVEAFTALVDKMISSDIPAMGQKAYDYMHKEYAVERNYSTIMAHFS